MLVYELIFDSSTFTLDLLYCWSYNYMFVSLESYLSFSLGCRLSMGSFLVTGSGCIFIGNRIIFVSSIFRLFHRSWILTLMFTLCCLLVRELIFKWPLDPGNCWLVSYSSGCSLSWPFLFDFLKFQPFWEDVALH